MPAAPRARWGYHRLTESAARRLVASADIRPGDLVLDLGAGDGILTRRLLGAGARVVAFELHPGRYERLCASVCSERVRFVRADVADLRMPRQPFKVVSNPPFAVSTAVLRRLTCRGSRLVSADLVLPWFVTRRWARGGRAGWTMSAGLQLPPAAFRPRATSPAVVLRVRRAGA